MDRILKEAAETGNVSKLYELLERDGNVLRRIDRVEFIDTPLHRAAEKGHIAFAMEIMSLKPSFARKLNHQGLSPLHLAVVKGQVKMALRLVEIDKNLVRVRGKNGETPLHCLSKVGYLDGLLHRFVKACPECIRDVTSQNRTALHIAVENNQPDALKVLIRSIRNKEYYEEVVNRQDEDGNTALHIAASNSQTEMLRLLLKCKADKHVRNHRKEMALDVAYDTESKTILRGYFSPKASKYAYELKKKFNKYVRKASSLIFRDMDNISGDDRNALLVVLGLLLTATFQATLSPPGGLWQDDGNSDSTLNHKPGKTIMDQSSFLFFYIPTYVAFMVSFFLTLALLKPYPNGFRTTLQVLLAFLVVCFDQSINIIAPTHSAFFITSILSGIIFVLMIIICIAYDVSKVSVFVVAWWIFPFFPVQVFGVKLNMDIIQGLLLFIILYHEFWKGTILAVSYSAFLAIYEFYVGDGFTISMVNPVIWIGGFWLFPHLCLFCVKLFINRCSRCCNFFLLSI